MKALIVRDLKKSYGEREVLRGINLEVKEGEIFALLGPNGAGKTTLIRILAEGLGYDSGEILIFERPLLKKTAQLIGYVPQDNIAYELLTVRENLEFYADLYGAPKGRIDELIERFSLPENQLAGKMSGGQKKRLNLAIALLHEPKLLILDEPSNGLDVPSRLELWRTIEGFKQEGKTVLIATHYMEEAERLADRVAIMNEGRVIAVGTVGELKAMVGEKAVVHVELSDGEVLRVPSKNPEEEIAKVVERFAGRGIKLVKVEEPTLEDVFVRLTGRGLE
ncbi:ABC transporter ATP-binding protein [Thermococcus sp.]